MEKTIASLWPLLEEAIRIINPDKLGNYQQQLVALQNLWKSEEVHIAIVGPFNQGKSTLLNALLGQKALPVDLIPTTGSAIYIRYGSSIHVDILLKNGERVTGKDTDLLKQYTILDENRQRPKVDHVSINLPHSILEMGVCLIDLPGINDREDQESYIRNEVLMADVVIVMLNAKQLWTRSEVDFMESWLLPYGIKGIIFVINFLSLLSEDDQKKVWERSMSLVEEFLSKLDTPIKTNLFKVDALPALRSIHNGNEEGLRESGLPVFKDNLVKVIETLQDNLSQWRSSRVFLLVEHITNTLYEELKFSESQFNKISSIRLTKITTETKQIVETSNIVKKKIKNLNKWSKDIVEDYSEELAGALRDGTFSTWKVGQVQRIENYFKDILASVNSISILLSYEFNISLAIELPSKPKVYLPSKPVEKNNNGKAAGGEQPVVCY
ncbi:dynamin family protein [Spirosoma foliorum]|uniref:Dynamin family protein n=1 Tax=Spirosoma foliorum TaxID=2710596 RepID=A0A7G5GRL3_9BACT|nr:dynamin family protein [Spirosoma foliorum]QMW01505.1 dynamin family protein [Spirosoma foliorum]